MMSQVDLIIQDYIQSAFDVAMKDRLLTHEEFILLNAVEQEFSKIRERIHQLYGTRELSDVELLNSIKLIVHKMVEILADVALADGRISEEEFAILEVISN